MIKFLKFIFIIIIAFLSLIAAFIVLDTCHYYFWSDIDFEEEEKLCLSISEEEDISEETIRSLASFVMDSPEELSQYLHQREYYGHLPFEGNLEIDSLDFDHYDYVFSEGYPISNMKKLLWDDCTSYESDSLTPLLFETGEQISRKVYIYKIKPKNKYRVQCG